MQVLLQLKQYNEYFDILLEEKKNNEWESLLNQMKDNKELEMIFKKRISLENDFLNINYVINKLWNEIKKISNNNDYILKLLCEILEILYKENQNKYQHIEKNKNMMNFVILVYIKCMKTHHNQFNEYSSRLDYFVNLFHNKINSTLLVEMLTNEGFTQHADKFSQQFSIVKYI